ncbi:MAG: cell division protein FtsQ [Idiomarinaceae bacterium HL-53]|nr:MAG: cell division protein FtsQ [Idiomarinaceae bacterium HL-53]CUS47390.1 cell division protein FtsQ [Idiomarinaceae bacterium HL-53]
MNVPAVRKRSEFWAGVVVFIVILAGLSAGTGWLYRLATDVEQTPFTEVVIAGERHYTTSKEVVDVLRQGVLGGFFTANADALRARVEGLPWVYSASIRREWPGTLHVFVVEEAPLAIWNESQLLNVHGDVFTAPVDDLKESLPALFGPEENVKEVLDYYQRFQTLLAQEGYVIRGFYLSERFATVLALDNGIELRLGRESQIERIQRFMDLLPVILAEQAEGELQRIEYIDLRYDTGLAVGWRETTTGE